jgi:hypothetical protein
MLAVVLTVTAVAVAVLDDEPGFGGADADAAGAADADAPADVPGAHEDTAPASQHPSPRDFVSGQASSTTLPSLGDGIAGTVFVPATPQQTKLEQDLARAHIDPAHHPLVALRVDVARLEAALEEAERHGLLAARDTATRLGEARALLADVERIALHRMSVCAMRAGQAPSTRNYRMTPGGPVRLSTRELLAQTSSLDPSGCARIDLIDAAVVARVRRARELRAQLATRTFAFHELDQRGALVVELKSLERELAKEDLPVLSAPGARDYGR